MNVVPDTYIRVMPERLNVFSRSAFLKADLDEEIGPDDDHLRPWKRERIATMAEVLASLRTELFPAEALVVVHCDDVGSTMGSWIIDAVRKLNSPERYAEWAAAYGID